ncbi:MAG: hypothetical protein ACRDSI_07810 [Pseudonocardiaceae bacterium]
MSGELGGGKPGSGLGPGPSNIESSDGKGGGTSTKVDGTTGKIGSNAMAAKEGVVKIACTAAKTRKLARLGSFLLVAALPRSLEVLDTSVSLLRILGRSPGRN